MIYLDNAATSFPKPPEVARAVQHYLTKCGANFGRGGYKSAVESMDALWKARESVAELIGCSTPERVIFTKNATEALNLAIKGCVPPGSSVLISPLEHNSVVRPLHELKCQITTLPLLPDGSCDVRGLPSQKFDFAVMMHGSNVSGAVNDIERFAAFCHVRGIPCLIDAAQTAGTLPIHADKMEACVAFAGHKGLLGPQGTGGLYLPKRISPRPLMSGGTGSSSELMVQPDMLPDRYESGTMNMPALCGLEAGCAFIKKVGMKTIHEHEVSLARRLSDGLQNMEKTHVVCPGLSLRTGVVSFFIDGMDTSEIGRRLDEEYHISVRCGLHCAPMAHQAYQTFETGTVRVSPGWFNTPKEIDKFLDAVQRISRV